MKNKSDPGYKKMFVIYAGVTFVLSRNYFALTMLVAIPYLL